MHREKQNNNDSKHSNFYTPVEAMYDKKLLPKVYKLFISSTQTRNSELCTTRLNICNNDPG